MTKNVTQIETILEAKEREATAMKEKDIVLAKDQQPFWNPMTFTPTDLAQQLSLIEWDLLRRVEPREFLSRAWLLPTREAKAPHLMRLIHRTNTEYRWVINELINSKDKRVQLKLFGHFLKVGTECAKLSNFNTAVAIAQALGQFKTRAGETLALRSKEANALRQLRSLLNLDAGGKCPFTSPAVPYISNFLAELLQKGDVTAERRQGIALFGAVVEAGAIIRDLMAATLKRSHLGADPFEVVKSLQKFLFLENIAMTRDFLIDLEQVSNDAPVAVKEADALTRLFQRSPEARSGLQFILTLERNYGVVIVNEAARKAFSAVVGENANAIHSSGSQDSLRSADSELEEDEGVKRRTVFSPMLPLPSPVPSAGLTPLSPTSSGRTPGGPPQLPVELKRSNSGKSASNSNRSLKSNTPPRAARPFTPDIQRSNDSARSNRSRAPDDLRVEWLTVLMSAGIPSERIGVVADVLVFELIEPSQLGLLDPALLQSLGITEGDSAKIIAWHSKGK